jgi:predicted metal-dependent hydrolase
MEQLTLLEPAYEVRASNRAKYAQIKITPAGKVLVVVPRRFNIKHVPAFVAEHQRWIDSQLQQLRLTHDPVYDSDSPQRIILRAVDETWQVVYDNQDKRKPDTSHRTTTTLVKRRDYENKLLTPATSLYINRARPIKPQLIQWLTGRARTALSERVECLSQVTGLLPGAIHIRGQKTRWGSCSVRRTLSLNRSLLFLPPPLVRYLLIHELCHLVHLNHSRHFWALVQRFEPDYEQLDRDLSAASCYIPQWALPE